MAAEEMSAYHFQGLCSGDYGIECGLGEISNLDTVSLRWGGKRATDCFSGTLLEMPQAFPVLLPVALGVPCSRGPIRAPG